MKHRFGLSEKEFFEMVGKDKLPARIPSSLSQQYAVSENENTGFCLQFVQEYSVSIFVSQ